MNSPSSNAVELPSGIAQKLQSPDGSYWLSAELPKMYPPETVKAENTEQMRIWDAVGQSYMNSNRLHEAIAIYTALYGQLLAFQENTGTRVHKGLPLVWMSVCYERLGYEVIRHRYLMLTLVEDAIRENGRIMPAISGVYFRLVWDGGLSHQEVERYAKDIYHFYDRNQSEA
jgi:hypothetical protein